MALVSQNPGKLDRRVRLQYAVETRDSAGGPIKAWVDAVTVWASWTPRAGHEMELALANHAEATGIFRIRFRTGLDPTWRLVRNDDVFEIVDIQEVGRSDYLDLVVTGLDQSPTGSLSVRLLHDRSPRMLHDGSFKLMHPAA